MNQRVKEMLHWLENCIYYFKITVKNSKIFKPFRREQRWFFGHLASNRKVIYAVSPDCSRMYFFNERELKVPPEFIELFNAMANDLADEYSHYGGKHWFEYSPNEPKHMNK